MSRWFFLTSLLFLGALAINEVRDRSFQTVLNAAIKTVLEDTSSTGCLSKVHHNYYGSGSDYPYPSDRCTAAVWPTLESIQAENSTIRQAIDTGRIVFGAQFPSGHDVFNCTQDASVTDVAVYSCAGYDQDTAKCFIDAINAHYGSSIKVYWRYSEWMADTNMVNNIVYNLLGYQFDGIFASMTANPFTTWPAPWKRTMRVPRSSLVNFTCPYQAGGESAAAGNKASPVPLTSAAALNTSGVIIAVEAGTSMEDWVVNYAPLAQRISLTDGSLCVKLVLNGTAHAYLAPHLNIASDIQEYGSDQLHKVAVLTTDSYYSIGLRPTWPTASGALRHAVPALATLLVPAVLALLM
ncbi:putative amino acid abc transporter [Paratrimastix pyriformis]|uniref:Amino acid abc transporter n=1 Tax=Paratrimastix pyriformis TaxID=342808 RepID=A0ABQ8UC25_9EUKA|nr:putative amino acid abc transporter [Paratrimastix pyriformis]